MRSLTYGVAAVFLAAAGVAEARTQMDQKNWDNLMQYYPKRALAAGEQGKVGFDLTLDRNGHPTACRVTYSSGHTALDNETCEVMLMHVVFQPPKDAEGNRLNLFRTEGVIDWRIPGNQAKIAAPVKIAARDAPEKQICKRSTRTGSLAGFDRICMTATEWERKRAEYRDGLEEGRKRGFTSGEALCVDGRDKC